MPIVSVTNFACYNLVRDRPETKKYILCSMIAVTVMAFFECCLIAKPLGRLISFGALVQVVWLYQRFTQMEAKTKLIHLCVLLFYLPCRYYMHTGALLSHTDIYDLSPFIMFIILYTS